MISSLRKLSACFACSALIVVMCVAALRAQVPAIEAIPVRGHIFLIGGAGSNITVSAGSDGVFLVDSGTAANADKVIAAIKVLQARLQLALPAAPRAGAETTTATNLEPFYRTLAPPIRKMWPRTGIASITGPCAHNAATHVTTINAEHAKHAESFLEEEITSHH